MFLNSEDDESAEEGKLHPALQNDVIIAHLSLFLGLSDLKNCRLVCKLWLDKMDFSFRRRSRVFLVFLYWEKRFLKDISEYLPKDTPLTAVELKGQVSWSLSDLNQFFADYGSNIRDFKMSYVMFATQSQAKNRIPIVKIDQFFSKNILQNLKSLTICSEMKKRTQFVIPLHLLENIEHLHLDKCILAFIPGKKIRPKILTLIFVQFVDCVENKPRTSILINNIVNMERLETLKLYAFSTVPANRHRVKMKIDMSTGITIKSVYFTNMKFVHWEAANWNIDTLFLDGSVNFVTRNVLMSIKNFYLVRGFCVERMELMPPSINRLVLMNSVDLDAGSVSTPFNLPNLETLVIFTKCHEILPNFSSCAKLSSLRLGGNDPKSVKTSLIPKQIKKLIVGAGVTFDFDSNHHSLQLLQLAKNISNETFYKDCTLAAMYKSFRYESVRLNKSPMFNTAQYLFAHLHLFFESYPEDIFEVGPFEIEETDSPSPTMVKYYYFKSDLHCKILKSRGNENVRNLTYLTITKNNNFNTRLMVPVSKAADIDLAVGQ